MKYEIKPMKDACYVDGAAVEGFFLGFEDTEENKASVFSVYEREADGLLRWIADFGERAEAEKWKEAMEKEGAVRTHISRADAYACSEALYSFCDGGCRRCPFKIDGDCKSDLIVAILEERMNEEENADDKDGTN
jgi:hypothetical protein